MQVDKNCNATGTTQNNQQIVALGANAKHGSEADPKVKDLQGLAKPPQEHTKSAAPGLGNETGNGAPKAAAATTPTATAAAAATVAASAHQTQAQAASATCASATSNPNQSQSAPMFDSVQQRMINRIVTTIVQQNNGSAKVQKIASESQIPTFRSGSNDSPPHKNNSGTVANACQHATYHQQNNSTSFANNAPKTDVKNVVNTEPSLNDSKNPVKRHSAPQVEVSHPLNKSTLHTSTNTITTNKYRRYGNGIACRQCRHKTLTHKKLRVHYLQLSVDPVSYEW